MQQLHQYEQPLPRRPSRRYRSYLRSQVETSTTTTWTIIINLTAVVCLNLLLFLRIISLSGHNVQLVDAFQNQNNTGVGTPSSKFEVELLSKIPSQSSSIVVTSSEQSTLGENRFLSIRNAKHDDDASAHKNITKALIVAGHHALSSSKAPLHIQATAIHVERAEFPLSKLLFKLILKLGLEQVERSLAWRRVKISLNLRSANTCTNQYAGALAAEEYYTRRTRLLIVSGCDDAIKSVSRLASLWKIPLMTAAGFSADFNDRLTHQSLTRVAFSLKTAVEFLVKIMKSFKWRRFNLIVDESDPNSLALRESIETNLAEYKSSLESDFHATLNILSFDYVSLMQSSHEYDIKSSASGSKQQQNGTQRERFKFNSDSSWSTEDRWPNELTERAIMDILRQASMFSKVSIVLIPQSTLRKFMLSVYDEGLANGQYSFITLPLLLETEDESGPTGSDDLQQHTAAKGLQNSAPAASSGAAALLQDNQLIWRSLTSKRNSQAKQAYESLMSIYVKIPTTKQYNHFARNLSDLANSDFMTGGSSSSKQQTALTRFGVTQQSTSQRSREKRIQININPYSAAFYDCLQIYARAVNESLAIIENETNQDKRRQMRKNFHANLTNFMRDKRYENMLTGTIYMNKNGARETEYSLDDMNQMGKFWSVINYNGETHMMERLAPIRWSADNSAGPTQDDVDCQLTKTCPRKALSRFTISLIVAGSFFATVISTVIILVYRHFSFESQLVDYWWKIRISDVEILDSRRKQAADGSSSVGSFGDIADPDSVASGDNTSRVKSDHGSKSAVTKVTTLTNVSSAVDATYGEIVLANYKLGKVALKPIVKFHQSRKLMLELKTIKSINHHNLNRFVGIITEEPHIAIVTEFCPKGSLREFIQNESMVIDWTFKYSMINDIMSGLAYLHSSPFEFHGRLKSGNCLVSSRFVVKLSDYGLNSLFDQIDQHETDIQLMKKHLWRAPEQLRSSGKKCSKKGDVYSLGLLLYEIVTNQLPFYNREKGEYILPLKSLVDEIKSNGPTSKIGPDMSMINLQETPHMVTLVNLIKSCIIWDPKERPTLTAAHNVLKKVTHGITSKKLLQNLTDRMEHYTGNLESMVDAKLATLIEEKHKAEELLYQFVPKSIAPLLKEGQTVEPEAFDCVTVFFSDIVGFTSLSSESTPMQVIDFLSELYLCFDETLDQYDCFKIDIVGDAYIVGSGVPQRNEGRHIIEIARAALSLRDRLSKFKIPHKPNRALEMRVGIHSGPCVGGIVGGVNMPKYCVFGETLSMGKFMESSGLPMKIHITEESKRLLDSIGGFTIETRTPKITKDGLQIQTYWLNNELQAV